MSDWMTDRLRDICAHYEKTDHIFSLPDPSKGIALANFAREVAESIGYRSSGGDE